MLDGLWTAVFSFGAVSSGGIVLLREGRVFGGDSYYLYLGTYTADTAGGFNASLRVSAYISGAVTIFGVPLREFELHLQGSVKGEQAQATGSVVGYPAASLRIGLTRRATL
jgi:hypothetical protein